MTRKLQEGLDNDRLVGRLSLVSPTDRKRQILDAAQELLQTQGYTGFSYQDLSRRLGIAKPSIHHHFPTKEALMEVVLKRACDRVAERTRDAWTTGENPQEALRSSLRELWRSRAEVSDDVSVVWDLLAQALHDPVVAPKAIVAGPTPTTSTSISTGSAVESVNR